MNFVNLQPYEQDLLLETKLNIYLCSGGQKKFTKVARFRPQDGEKYVLQHPQKGVLVMFMKKGNVYYNKYEGKFNKEDMKKLVKNFDRVLKCSCQSSVISDDEELQKISKGKDKDKDAKQLKNKQTTSSEFNFFEDFANDNYLENKEEQQPKPQQDKPHKPHDPNRPHNPHHKPHDPNRPHNPHHNPNRDHNREQGQQQHQQQHHNKDHQKKEGGDMIQDMISNQINKLIGMPSNGANDNGGMENIFSGLFEQLNKTMGGNSNKDEYLLKTIEPVTEKLKLDDDYLFNAMQTGTK